MLQCENPILFDATCNGIQHLAALTRELDIALKVNLVQRNNTDQIYEEKPQDFLQQVMLQSVCLLTKEGSSCNCSNSNVRRNIKLDILCLPADKNL